MKTQERTSQIQFNPRILAYNKAWDAKSRVDSASVDVDELLECHRLNLQSVGFQEGTDILETIAFLSANGDLSDALAIERVFEFARQMSSYTHGKLKAMSNTGLSAAGAIRDRFRCQQLVAPRFDPAKFQQWATSAPTDDLWWTVRSHVAPFDLRCQALDELVLREDPAMPEYLVKELNSSALSPRFRDALLLVTDSVQVEPHELRLDLAKALIGHARRLYAHGKGAPKDEPGKEMNARANTPLWAAIWRYATLRFEADVGVLVELIRPQDPLPHVHAILLAVINAFTSMPPSTAEEKKLDLLRQRVTQIAHAALSEEKLTTTDDRAIAVSSYCAAVVLMVPELSALTNQFVSLNKRWMLTYVLDKLQDADSSWNAVTIPNTVPYAKMMLAQTVAKLQERTSS